ncbi:iron-sulfur cluster assembly scaffold protein [Patescibacteria group bacterium]
MDDIYQEIIVDHYKNPRNFGDFNEANLTGRGANASCGDMLEMYLLEKDGKIEKISFKGIGCAMTTASASMLTEEIVSKKMSVDQVLEMDEDDLVEIMGIEVSPTRRKCVELPLRVLHDLLKKNDR